jgi:hypothetical protein
MPSPLTKSHFAFAAEPDGLRERRVAELAARINRTLGVARALAKSGRALDLTGIEDGVGVLCAQTLDLPTGDAREMVPVLREVLAQVDLLSVALRQEAPGCGQAGD